MAKRKHSDLFSGITYLSRGLSLASQKGLRAHIVIPIMVNIVLFSAMTFLLVSEVNGWINSTTFQITLPNWLSLLQPVIDFIIQATEALIWILVVVVIILFTTSFFTALTNLIAAPFNGYLAERAEAKQRTINYPSLTVSQLIGRTLRRELTKLGYWLTRLILLFILTLFIGFIPVINVISPLLWLIFGAWMLGIQYIDYAADNNGLEFDEMLKRLHQNRLAVLSFGFSVMAITLMPLINLMIVPVAICGATAFWVNLLDTQQQPSSQSSTQA